MKKISMSLVGLLCSISLGTYVVSTQTKEHAAMKLTSQNFSTGEKIPATYSGEGQDISPELSWSGAPQHTKSFVLIVDDPDAPTPKPWVHWVVYNIPGSLMQFAENVKIQAPTLQGVTSFNAYKYNGPKPPKGHGPHRYHFKLYALDIEKLPVGPGATKEQVENGMKNHILAHTELIGTYERN